MKNLFVLLALLSPLFINAQSSGEITYLETVKMVIHLEGPEAEEMRKMIPPSQSFHRQLTFNETNSLWVDAPESEGEGNQEISHQSDGGAQFQIKMQRPDNKLFKDLDTETSLESQEFFGRYFLVSGELKKFAWKLTGEQKKVAGYACQKATAMQDSTQIEAWFTTQIPVSNGPGHYGQLPGMILEMSIDNGNRTAVAVKVDLKPVASESLEKPSKGKEVTEAEFNKIREEKMKEMGMETGGSGGGVRMIIRN